MMFLREFEMDLSCELALEVVQIFCIEFLRQEDTRKDVFKMNLLNSNLLVEYDSLFLEQIRGSSP